jgi:hypothetical protein
MVPEDNGSVDSTANTSPLLDGDSSTLNGEVDAISENLERIENLQTFVVQNLYPDESEEGEITQGAQESSTQEISEEEKNALFFAPDYQPSPEEIDRRAENIKKSELEFKPIGEATPENNVILAVAKEKAKTEGQTIEEETREPAIVTKFKALVIRVDSIKTIKKKGFSKEDASAVVQEYTSRGEEPRLIRAHVHHIGEITKSLVKSQNQEDEDSLRLTPKQTLDLAVKGYDRLNELLSSRGYYHGIKIYEGNSRREFNKETQSKYSRELITPQDFIDIATSPEEKWEELRNNLSRIPHLTESSLSLHGMVSILNGGFTESQEEQLESMKRGCFIKKGDPLNDYEFLIFNLTRGEEGVEENKGAQNVRAYMTYSGESYMYHEDGNIIQDLRFLRYGLVSNHIYQSGGEGLYKKMEEYMSPVEGSSDERAPLDMNKVSFFKAFLNSKIAGSDKERTLRVFEWVTNPENYDLIKRVNRDYSLGIRTDKLDIHSENFSKNNVNLDLEILENQAIRNFNDQTSLQISNFEEVERYLAESQDNRNIFRFVQEYGHVLHDGSKSREELQEMFITEGDELYPTSKYYERLVKYHRIYRVPNIETFFKLENTEKIKEPDSRAFWGLVTTHPGQLNAIFRAIDKSNFDYERLNEGFIEEYCNISGNELFLNENFYRSIVGDHILRKELSENDISGSQHTIGNIFGLVDQRDVERFSDPKAKFFWSLAPKFNLNNEKYASLRTRLLLETYTKVSDSDNPDELKYIFNGKFDYDRFVDQFGYEIIGDNGEVSYGLNEEFVKSLAIREPRILLSDISIIDDNFIRSIDSEEGREFWSLFREADESVQLMILDYLREKGNPELLDDKVFSYNGEFNYSEFLSGFRYELLSDNGEIVHGFNESFIKVFFNKKRGPEFIEENISLIDDNFIQSVESKEGKEFWSLFREADGSLRPTILEYVIGKEDAMYDGEFNYSEFLSKFCYELTDQNGLVVRGFNEEFVKSIAIKEPRLLLWNMSLINEDFMQSIESKGGKGGKEFWSFFRNCNSSVLPVVLEKLWENDQPEVYSKFLETYTHIVESEGIPERVFNEAFVKEIARSHPSVISTHADEILSDKMLKGLSENGKVFWGEFVKIKDSAVRKSILPFYVDNEDITEEQAISYITIIQRINNSPSKELLQMKDNILSAICTKEKTLEEAEREYELIKQIFERNNSPLALLRSRVFESLHLRELVRTIPDEYTSQEFTNILLNPDLTEEGKGRVFSDLLKKDLLNIAKDSVDENFYNFLSSLRDGMEALTFYDQFIQQGYTDEEVLSALGEEEREYLAKSLDIFFVASEEISTKEEISERIDELRHFLGINKGETLSTGVYNTYIDPILDSPTGFLYKDIGTILEEMSSIKEETHLRGLEYASGKRKIEIVDGDHVKRVDSIEGAINEGFLAKYFLGMERDGTPFDTDTIRAQDVDSADPFLETLRENVADTGFGGIILVIKNRGQFKNPNGEKRNYPNPRAQYELIQASYYQGRNYGIRTGFASTEIDFICFDEEIFDRTSKKLRDRGRDRDRDRDLQLLKFHIASKGIYIPIINAKGEIIYTPEEFEEQRETFAGVPGLSGKSFGVKMKTTKITSTLEKMTEGLSEDREKVARISTHIQDSIEAEIKARNLIFEDSRTGLEGLRIEHIGSTSRLTHVIGSSDFDFSILLDRNQLIHLSTPEREQLINDIIGRIGVLEHPGETYNMGEDTLQRTGSKVKLESGEIIEFDLAVTDKRGNLDGSNSHEFVIDRLNSIKENLGEEAYEFVVANILYAKKFLKKNQCYKKRQEGGMGGIGIENWILQHHGNFEEATDAFLSAARNPDGTYADFGTFKGRYTVFDPGKDIRTGLHDNFITDNMTKEGYEKMLSALIKFERG